MTARSSMIISKLCEKMYISSIVSRALFRVYFRCKLTFIDTQSKMRRKLRLLRLMLRWETHMLLRMVRVMWGLRCCELRRKRHKMWFRMHHRHSERKIFRGSSSSVRAKVGGHRTARVYSWLLRLLRMWFQWLRLGHRSARTLNRGVGYTKLVEEGYQR